MKKHKLLSLTLATFITLGSIAPAIYSPKLAYAKDIDENDSKINNQQTSESLIKKEDKTEENLGVKPQENHDQKVEEKTEKKSEEKLDISPEKNPKPQSSQQAQTRGVQKKVKLKDHFLLVLLLLNTIKLLIIKKQYLIIGYLPEPLQNLKLS